MTNDQDDDREVYAAAGLALRCAQHFETELVNVALFHGVARNRFSVRSEAVSFVEQQDRRPLKKLLREVLSRVHFEPDLTATLEDAIEKRNGFVHRYFWDRVEAFNTPDGRAVMKRELHELAETFHSATTFASMLSKVYLKQIDLSEDIRRSLLGSDDSA